MILNRIVGFLRGGLSAPIQKKSVHSHSAWFARVTRLTNQLDLVIRQNKVIIDVLMKIRDSLKGGAGTNAENLHADYFE